MKNIQSDAHLFVYRSTYVLHIHICVSVYIAAKLTFTYACSCTCMLNYTYMYIKVLFRSIYLLAFVFESCSCLSVLYNKQVTDNTDGPRDISSTNTFH